MVKSKLISRRYPPDYPYLVIHTEKKEVKRLMFNLCY